MTSIQKLSIYSTALFPGVRLFVCRMLKAYMNASPAEAAYTTFETVSPSPGPGASSPAAQDGASGGGSTGGRGKGSTQALGVPEVSPGKLGGTATRVNLEEKRLSQLPDDKDDNEDDDE